MYKWSALDVFNIICDRLWLWLRYYRLRHLYLLLPIEGGREEGWDPAERIIVYHFMNLENAPENEIISGIPQIHTPHNLRQSIYSTGWSFNFQSNLKLNLILTNKRWLNLRANKQEHGSMILPNSGGRIIHQRDQMPQSRPNWLNYSHKRSAPKPWS